MKFGKMSLFVTAAGLLALSSSAFAEHAYRSMECRSKTHLLRYKGDEPVGGDYGLSKLGDDIEQEEYLEVLSLPSDQSDVYGKDELSSAGVLFNEKLSANLTEKEKSSECGFDREEWTSYKTIRFEKVSPAAAKRLDLKQGSEMKFTCEEALEYPNGKDCE